MKSKWTVATLASFIIVFCSSIAAMEETEKVTITAVQSKTEYYVGENVLFTCVIYPQNETQTIIWSKIFDGKKKILTINTLKVTRDPRIQVLHDKGGEVWVLSIKNVTEADSGGYICRLNTSPPRQKFFTINVKPSIEAKVNPNTTVPHDYTKCCKDMGVDDKCLGYCSISNIMEGSTGVKPEECEKQFPKIVQCMADLRDHSPCCENQNIPYLCQDLCRGEYTIQEDSVQTQFSCSAYTVATLTCISEGIEILPRAPENPSAVSSGPTSITVEWDIPKNSPNIEHFVINATKLQKFDPPYDISKPTNLSMIERRLPFPLPEKWQVRVAGNASHFNLERLSPLTWYEISVKSINNHGSSMASYRLRVLTKSSNDKSPPIHPKLPDITGCCKEKGVTHERCLQKLCNPHQRYIEETDIVVCAAWANESFSCLSGNLDHSDCCRSKGLPDKCVELCSGNITHIDYTYFKCVDYFSDYRSCLLKGYGVLPSQPLNVKVTNIHSTFALLSWEPPTENSNSVTSFHSYFRSLEPNATTCKDTKDLQAGPTGYHGVQTSTSPSVIEFLCPGISYEIYVQAFNIHGISEPSSRIIFTTTSVENERRMFAPYNVTDCCRQMTISPGCRPLCDYNPRMSQVRSLSGTCRPEMPYILKCVVGGRDHRPCCQRKGVPENCMSICAGSFHGKDSVSANCLPYLGNIMLCLEEGIGILPGPINGLHATEIKDGKISLVWNPPSDGANITYYQVQYQMVDAFSSTHNNYAYNNTMNITLPIVTIEGLKPTSIYNFFVLAMNEWGSSLPSAILTVNMTISDTPTAVAGVVSAPHSLILEAKSATSLTIVWQPPVISHPTDRFGYEIHYAPLAKNNETLSYKTYKTGANAYKLSQLIPNTQYVIFTIAVGALGKSTPSETLLVWTDPAFPAFVETPTIHPTNLKEGGTMTILCTAMGSPPPKVSLYIAGKLVHEEITQHMVTIVKNITRQMSDIACYATNGYGTPMQASAFIPISHRPSISASEIIRAVKGSVVEIECRVTAWPKPAMVWWLDPETRVPIIEGGNITIKENILRRGTYVMRIKFPSAEDRDYYCAATNILGSFTRTVKLRVISEVKLNLNVTECCHTSDISQACISACDFGQVDFHKIMNTDECIPDFEKFLKCGADGSDHRGCCAKAGMPIPCLDWCRGRISLANRFNKICLLQWAPTVFDCFHEGQGKLPGPPQNLQIMSLSSTSAKITWEAPLKNPEGVDLYRLFWRANGTTYPFKSDTVGLSADIFDLKEGYNYETAVKAGNSHGTSVLSVIKTFKHHRSYISSQSTSETDKNGIIFGIIFSILCVVLALLGGRWFMRRRLNIPKGTKGVSFENPSYIREQGDAVQIAETPTEGTNNTIISHGSPKILNLETNIIDASNTQSSSSPTNAPGFDNDSNPKGKYTRFKG